MTRRLGGLTKKATAEHTEQGFNEEVSKRILTGLKLTNYFSAVPDGPLFL